MSTLHLITQNSTDVLANCQALAGPDDTLLLLGNGCYLFAVDPGSKPDPRLRALEPDVRTRGLSGRIPSEALVSDEAFVALAVRHEKSLTW